MQAYAEGFEVLEQSEFDLDLHEIAGIWRYGSVVRSWLLELLHRRVRAARAATSSDIKGYVEDSGRGPLDDRRGDRRGRAGAGDHRGALRALRLAAGRVVRGQGERGAPQPVRRPRGQGRAAKSSRLQQPSAPTNPLARGPARSGGAPEPCALVIFGASGDLTAAQADAGALRARRSAACCPSASPSSAPRAREETDDELPRADEGGGRSDTRATSSGRTSGTSSRRGCATSRPTSPTTGGEDGSPSCSSELDERARHAAATASTTSPSRRARSDDRRRASASAATARAGRG